MGEGSNDGDISTIKEQFGNIRQLTVDIREQKTDQEAAEKLPAALSVAVDEIEVKLEESKFKVSFNGSKVKLSEVMNYIMANFNVLDFGIKEMDIEDIVKTLY